MADAEISTGSTNAESILKIDEIPSNHKTGLKRGQTFVVKKNEEKLEKQLIEVEKNSNKNFLNPEKINTLKATLLSLGRFDIISTNVSFKRLRSL